MILIPYSDGSNVPQGIGELTKNICYAPTKFDEAYESVTAGVTLHNVNEEANKWDLATGGKQKTTGAKWMCLVDKWYYHNNCTT